MSRPYLPAASARSPQRTPCTVSRCPVDCGALSRSLLALSLLGLSLIDSSDVHASDWVDTRITFVFSDDNVLADPGETVINSPDADFGPREGNFFPFENLNSRDSGQETLSHLVLYSRLPGFFPRLITEAGLVLRSEIFGDGDVSLSDDGSYIRLQYSLDAIPPSGEADGGDAAPAIAPPGAPAAEAESGPESFLGVTMFPYTSERFRLGYAYDLSWGGESVFTERNDRPVPAVRFDLQQPRWYLFAGAKTTQQVQATEDPDDQGFNELARFYALLAGAGVDLADWLTWEVNGGYILAGTNRKSGIEGEPVTTAGVSTRVTLHRGFGVARSLDFKLYRNGPDVFDIFLRTPPQHHDELAWRISVEGSWLTQRLGDPDRFGGTEQQPARAGMLSADIGIGDVELNADIVLRDLAFLRAEVPGLDTFNALPDDAETNPELLAALSASYHIRRLHLTPSLLGGIQLPATYRSQVTEVPNQPETVRGEQTVVVLDDNRIELLPEGEQPLPIPGGKLGLRFDLSQMLSVLGQAVVSYNRNQTRLVNDAFGIPQREFRDPWVFGFAVLTQARF